MAKKKNTIFISFSSKDIGDKGYVQAVESAIHSVGYEADHMNRGVLDATAIQPELDERIRRSRLVIMVLDQQYKDCKRLRHEFEEVTQRGNKIKTLIFIKDYNTLNERRNQDENIFNVLNINENRYNRFENFEDLRKNVQLQLNQWYKEELLRIERKRRMRQTCLYVFAALVLGFCFWWAVHDTTSSEVSPEPPVTPYDTIPPVRSPRDTASLIKIEKSKTTPKSKPKPEPKPSVVALNTFTVDCDDELLSAGIFDAVSQILPSMTQSVDTSKAQWTILVKQDSVQDISKILESDPLQVEVNYIIEITNNAEKKKITKVNSVRGRSIDQDRNDAIRNANEETSKMIADILKKQCNNENI